MKAIILKNPLNKISLLRNTANFFKELKQNLGLRHTNKIFIDKIILTLKNGDEYILLENMECDLNNKNVIISLRRLILHKYAKGINENINLNKDSNSLIFIYHEK